MITVQLLVACFTAAAAGQQVYISSNGTSARPYCDATLKANATAAPATPSFYFSAFSFTQTETYRNAVSATPAASTTTYAPPYASVSILLGNLSTTSWGNWNTAASAATSNASSSDPYGEAAYSALWENAGLTNVTSGLYTATVSPTPVPTSELILPPPLYFGPHDCYNFPSDFMLGVSGAAAQIEGAVADEGKSPAFPDFLGALASYSGVSSAPYTDTYTNNFVAAENYYLYKQDIERLASTGLKYYSFSISWSRIMPFALPGSPLNSQGLQHYDDLIDFIIEKGMVPVVTLLHMDPPAVFLGGGNLLDVIEDQSELYFGSLNCGFQNETFQEAFINYGKIVMAHYADRVPIWLTINEPQVCCVSGPSIDNVIKSHAALYHFYHDELQGTGTVSIKMGATPAFPQISSNASHVEAAQHYTDLNIGTFLNPLAQGEDYPDALKMTIQDYVPLSADDLTYLNGTIDFIACDMYTAYSVYPEVDIAICAADNSSTNALYPSCVGTTNTNVFGWALGYRSEYMATTTPKFLRSQLNYLWNTWRYPVVITEFGLSTAPWNEPTDANDALNDFERSEYYLSYLTEVLKAIWEDGVNVMGAFMWSYVDNWEWGTFDHHFGLQRLNTTTQVRTYRRSIFDVVDFVETRRAA